MRWRCMFAETSTFEDGAKALNGEITTGDIFVCYGDDLEGAIFYYEGFLYIWS